MLQPPTTILCSTTEGLITDRSITAYEQHSSLEKNCVGFAVCMYKTKSCSWKLPPAVKWRSVRRPKSNIPAKAWSSIKARVAPRLYLASHDTNSCATLLRRVTWGELDSLLIRGETKDTRPRRRFPIKANSPV